MGTIYTAIAIFGMTAILGMYLLSLVLKDKQIPKGAAFIHGVFAVTAVVLLIVYCVGHDQGPMESIIIFAIAALGGLIMIYRDLTGKPVPKWLAIAHGLTAVVGFAFLLCFAFL